MYGSKTKIRNAKIDNNDNFFVQIYPDTMSTEKQII